MAVRTSFEDTDDFYMVVPLTGLEPVTPALRMRPFLAEIAENRGLVSALWA